MLLARLVPALVTSRKSEDDTAPTQSRVRDWLSKRTTEMLKQILIICYKLLLSIQFSAFCKSGQHNMYKRSIAIRLCLYIRQSICKANFNQHPVKCLLIYLNWWFIYTWINKDFNTFLNTSSPIRLIVYQLKMWHRLALSLVHTNISHSPHIQDRWDQHYFISEFCQHLLECRIESKIDLCEISHITSTRRL